jgi:voltage-dependent potassium channel beta subunit
MNYRKLGRYGIKVSEVALGGWLTQGRTLADETTNDIVKTAFDLGVNFFDTADVYHGGEAEKALAKSIADFRRADIVIGTKCYFPMSDRPNDSGLSRKHIHESVHDSLKRLNTDYIDIMQFHRFDANTPMDEIVRAIDDLVRQGKVLYWGVSEWKGHQIMDAVRTAEKLNAHPPASNQPIYNMLTRGIEDAVLPVSEQLGIGNVVFSPLAQGVLTGKYLPGKPLPEGSRGADTTSNQFMTNMLNDELFTRVQKLKDFAVSHGHTLAQFALAWCLRQPAVSSVIIGATSTQQVEVNVTASGIKLDAGVWAEAEAILQGKTDEQ